MAQELDFENFKVVKEREEQIRGHLERMKSENWMNDLKILALELGTETRDEESGLIPGLLKDNKSMVYNTPLDHAAGAWSLRLNGAEFRLFQDEKAVVEVSFLPKGEDFLLMYVDEGHIEKILALREALAAEIKAARAKKSQRQAKFKEAFGR